MPPKPPSQAGKFKPLKRPVKKAETAPTAASASATPSASSSGGRGSGTSARTDDRGSGPRGDHRSRSPNRGRGGRGSEQDGRGSGRGRGRGGRDGRGGRGGRGGRFVIPTGAAFFTGGMAKSEQGGKADGLLSGMASGGDVGGDVMIKVEAGRDGAVVMPGMGGGGAMIGGMDGGGGGGGLKVSKNLAESMAAAARARLGEGEEIVVAEMELEPGEEENDGKKRSALDGPSSSRFDGMPSLFDNENETNADMNDQGIADSYVYDSDSSAEEERRVRRMQHNKSDLGGGGLAPTQLPFPVGPYQKPMYSCQEKQALKAKSHHEEKKEDGQATTSSVKLSDPQLQSPFLDFKSVSEEMKRMEYNSWFLMKFPTRLPHLDSNSSSTAPAVALGGDMSLDEDDNLEAVGIKSELTEEVELVGSSTVDTATSSAAGGGSGANNALASSSSGGAGVITSGPLGYDDTLKDVAPGRYGKIVVYKSGRTELVVGGEKEGSPEVRMLIHEGLQFGFRQEAVAIDPDEATFVSLGDVNKSLIVTPDVERAFAFS